MGHDLVLSPGVAVVVHDASGRVLVERRSDDPSQFSLPAGATDPGESPAQTAIREVFEETGLLIRPTRVLGVFGGKEFRTTYPNGDEVEYTVIVFAANVIGGTLTPRDGEALELLYLAPDRIPDLGLPYPAWVLAADATESAAWFEPASPRGEA